MIRLGILGAARIAKGAIFEPAPGQDGISVHSIASRSLSRAEAMAEEWGVPNIAASYAALISAPDIDAIYIGLPPSEHREWTLAALAAGKHVLCEKPFAMNAAEAAEMEEAARVSGLVLMEAFHYRFHPLFQKLIEIVEGGALGRIRSFHAQFNVPIRYSDSEFRYDPALGGGALMDLGCYPIHWARTLLGREPRVSAATIGLHASGVDEFFEATLDFEEGVTGFVTSSMREDLPRVLDAGLRLTGERGELIVDNPLAPQLGNRVIVKAEDDETEISIDEGTTYEHQLRHFVDLVNGHVDPVLPAGDPTAQMKVLDAIRQFGETSAS